MRSTELKKRYKDEKVYVIPNKYLFKVPNGFTDISKYNKKQINNFMSIFENKGFFIPRYDAEYNDAMQQIIPYTIILNKNESKMYVSYRIDGDPRLNNVYSLGFGGHINIEDMYSLNNDNYYSLTESAANREIQEEIYIHNNSINKTLIGFVRDIISETKEHFGIIYALKFNNKISIKETNKLKGKWMSMAKIVDNYYQFEAWSRYIIDHLFVLHKNNKKLLE